MAQFDIYGIRHHGPGSARALLRALTAAPPDVLAVEMPADLQTALPVLSDPALRPPVALVAYEPDRVEHALYYPLADFSPEWVAMSYCAARGIPIHAMDLPATLMIAYGRAHRMTDRRKDFGMDAASGDPDSLAGAANAQLATARMRFDPLGELARLAGYDDRERWWERTFELDRASADIFPAVTRMIAILREAYPEATDAECRLREGHMARSLLSLAKAGHQRIAVVCGAWHAPALAAGAAPDPFPHLRKLAAGYTKAKSGLKGPKLTTTWIPWTYERLRTGAGYAAGVRSPVWYELLFRAPELASEQYLTLIARELRGSGAAASTAQVVDAVDLADALRSLRGYELAGLDEIQEAALSALTQGAHPLLEQALSRVESNRTTGHVPATLRSLPLQIDLEARLKATRLLVAYRDMEPVEREFDLRKPAHLAASQLICQLLLIELPFGERLADHARAQGTFRELWRLHWRPDFALSLIAAHRFGHRVPDAARAALRERLDRESDLLELARAVDLILVAGLFEALDEVASRIRTQAAEVSDVWMLARVLPEFLRLSRYPSLRVQDVGTLDGLNAVMLPKLAAGLSAACRDLDEEAAGLGFESLRRLQPYVGMLDEGLRGLWLSALRQVNFDRQANPLLQGFALRTLVDAEEIRGLQLQREFGLPLSREGAVEAAAKFLEGFLYSSAQVLLHEPEILRALNEWVLGVELERFRDLLPALRRTFAQFARSERRKLSTLVSTLETPVNDRQILSPPPLAGVGLSPKPDLADWPELKKFLAAVLNEDSKTGDSPQEV